MSKSNMRKDQNENNPCLREQEISLKCLEQNGYDKDKCGLQFLNYKRCKVFWTRVIRDRQSRGISPDLPPIEERARAKKEYLNIFGLH
ncbi:coiled-coil-helix-coiled-coil-helix domain-containing protein 7-like isoform X1 [Varroa jacobsoni]|uniref:coiled-coil-helix-coiled-coil-helix domain-containing protein 7-like isoform X1 n=1 Tax=Varroa jacobsoni TaxID=62625 RepID=UPI000BF9C424|nr:coiled-coil-helix-coiled-coil-helix domain-containing protein 7-like isoform X1 [Varroa jacobsoni]